MLEMSISGNGPEGSEAKQWLWVRTFVCLPMIVDDRAVGALTLAHPEAHPVDSSQVNRAATIANHLAVLLERIEADRSAPARALGRAQHTSPTELERILPSFVAGFRRRGLELRVQDLPPVAQLGTNRRALHRIVALYLTSAMRFASGGVVDLSAFPPDDAEQLFVSFEVDAAGRTARGLELADDADLERRSDPAALAVANCRRLVASLGGSLELFDGDAGRVRVVLGARLGRPARTT